GFSLASWTLVLPPRILTSPRTAGYSASRRSRTCRQQGSTAQPSADPRSEVSHQRTGDKPVPGRRKLERCLHTDPLEPVQCPDRPDDDEHGCYERRERERVESPARHEAGR